MTESEEKSELVGTQTDMTNSSSEPSIVPEEHPEHAPDHESTEQDRRAHLHLKTFLAVFAVLLVYFAQLVSLIGAGAVSLHECKGERSYLPRTNLTISFICVSIARSNHRYSL